MYSIKAASSLTGLNTETLRAWERRYAAVLPERDANGRRIYSQQDIKRLTLLKDVTGRGHTISKIAKLNITDLEDLLEHNQNALQLSKETFYIQVLDALKNYQLDRCEDLLRQGLIAMDPVSFATEILMPTLKKVGGLWHEGKISVAQEHFFSNCVKRIIFSMLHNSIRANDDQLKLIFTAPSQEHHEFGILMSCLIASYRGCNCFYLGANLPVEELDKIQQQLNADVIVLGLVNTPLHKTTLHQLRLITTTFNQQVPLWLGGAGAYNLLEKNSFIDAFQLIKDLQDFDAQLQQLLKQKQFLSG